MPGLQGKQRLRPWGALAPVPTPQSALGHHQGTQWAGGAALGDPVPGQVVCSVVGPQPAPSPGPTRSSCARAHRV